ncbi:hypothetical protein A7A08_00912 [Methyloligella halotolerans]|uniref:Uncharacterized protein n=2 Tax=Methyloligella halotolerans TaxID=1177755 RepID=A0A1E2S0A9_9HYPH|nr:hypothetical protein A7A08_00912 [Methyloligella halotolerans]
MAGLGQPPEEIRTEAVRRADSQGKPVYIYRDGEEWRIAAKLTALPPGAQSWEFRPTSHRSETENFGGC